MNRTEQRLLRDVIRAVAHHDRNAWWELKRQIFEFGFQSDYPIKGDFVGPAERLIANLPDETKGALIAEWQKAFPAAPKLDDAKILATYSWAIVEEVVNRARVAAYRTENW